MFQTGSMFWIAVLLVALVMGPFALLSRRQVQTLRPMRTALEQQGLRDALASTTTARGVLPLDKR